MTRSTLKSIFSILALVGGAALMIYAARTGFEKQARIDCLNAARICDDFKDVHRGRCRECDLVKYCVDQGLLLK